MEIMIVLSKHKESKQAKKIEKKIIKEVSNPMINISEEIEVFIESDGNEKTYIDRIRKIAEKYEYEMEVIK